MKKIILMFLGLSFVACNSNVPKMAKAVPVESWHEWEAGRAKPCMFYNGNSVVEGGPRMSRVVVCFDQQVQGVPRGVTLEPAPNNIPPYVVVGTVELDDTAEKLYGNSKKFGVRLLCTKIGTQAFTCVYDNRDDSLTSTGDQH